MHHNIHTFPSTVRACASSHRLGLPGSVRPSQRRPGLPMRSGLVLGLPASPRSPARLAAAVAASSSLRNNSSSASV